MDVNINEDKRSLNELPTHESEFRSSAQMMIPPAETFSARRTSRLVLLIHELMTSDRAEDKLIQVPVLCTLYEYMSPPKFASTKMQNLPESQVAAEAICGVKTVRAKAIALTDLIVDMTSPV